MAITVLKIKALPDPIDDENWIEIEYSCSKCDKPGTVCVTDGQWQETVGRAIPNFLCAKCGGWERSGSEKIEQEKLKNSNPRTPSMLFTGSDAAPPRRFPW